jgi:hypothetical protein
VHPAAGFRLFLVLPARHCPLTAACQMITVSLGFDHLVAAGTTQCSVFSVQSWSTPAIVDLKEAPVFIMQTERCGCLSLSVSCSRCASYFALADTSTGLQLFSYEGKPISNPKWSGMRPETLNRACVALANDIVAVVDRAAPKSTPPTPIKKERERLCSRVWQRCFCSMRRRASSWSAR